MSACFWKFLSHFTIQWKKKICGILYCFSLCFLLSFSDQRTVQEWTTSARLTKSQFFLDWRLAQRLWENTVNFLLWKLGRDSVCMFVHISVCLCKWLFGRKLCHSHYSTDKSWGNIKPFYCCRITFWFKFMTDN